MVAQWYPSGGEKPRAKKRAEDWVPDSAQGKPHGHCCCSGQEDGGLFQSLLIWALESAEWWGGHGEVLGSLGPADHHNLLLPCSYPPASWGEVQRPTPRKAHTFDLLGFLAASLLLLLSNPHYPVHPLRSSLGSVSSVSLSC